MSRVLLVDDDPVVVRIYKEGLVHRGLIVDTAVDGITALSAMHRARPDVLVLDLMMPRLSGQEVLKLMRSQPALANIPVVILSNSYMAELTKYATAVGTVRSLLKIQCNPEIMFEAIQEVLVSQPAVEEPAESSKLAEPVRPEPPPPTTQLPSSFSRATAQATPLPGTAPAAGAPWVSVDQFSTAGNARAAALAHSASPFADQLHDKEVRARAREEFLANAPANSAALRTLFHAFASATEETMLFRLEDLYRKVHFLTGTAGLAECHHVAQMAAVFEAMLYQMMDQPSRITPSVLRTSAMAIDFINMLFGRASWCPGEAPLPRGNVLVVDDDPVCTRLVLWALQQAHLECRSAENAGEALDLLKNIRFDLVLLDVGLPDMDGIEFCKLLRTMPECSQLPVIHCTSHTDFQTRTQSALSGGDDFISKPVLPMELALKAVMHLLERQHTRPPHSGSTPG